MSIRVSVAALGLALATTAFAQTSLPAQNSETSATIATPVATAAISPVSELIAFKDSDIKFSLQSLMSTLRGHEGWVLAAYPDPNTSRPLIGAGFSLDLQERAHPQRDPLNSHPFLEPSSAQLWQAAGLEPERLQAILRQFDTDSSNWTKKTFQRKIRAHALAPQITEQDAMQLLRVAAIQAIYNAHAYCRNFDKLSGPQQMAFAQLVYQMGVNLEQFVRFLNVVNGEATADDVAHWKEVQHSLMTSQWARRYSLRATKVIAMFNPEYLQAPTLAEREIGATLRPVVIRRHGRGHGGASLRLVSHTRHMGKHPAKKLRGAQAKRKLT